MSEANRRDASRERVLEALKSGPKTNLELNQIAFRYGARLHELKQQGIAWTKRSLVRGVFEYSL